MMQGEVKWFNKERGYGFIQSDTGDVFVHQSEILMDGFRSLDALDRVSFEVKDSDRGPYATQVKKLNGGEK